MPAPSPEPCHERTGEPLQNIALWVESFETGSFGEAVTNEQGHYRIGRLEAGEGYVLTASGPGYSYRLLEDVVLPEEGLVQDVALVRTGAVKGTIRDSYDMPIEGAIVVATQTPSDQARYLSSESDAQGNYCFCNLDATPRGLPYILMAMSEGYSTETGAEATVVSLEQGQDVSAEKNFVLAELGEIQGSVIGSTAGLIEKALVRITPTDFSVESREVETDQQGAFVISGLSVDETYTVFVEAPCHRSYSIDVALSQEQPFQDIVVETEYSEWIEGVVQDINTGQPIPNATLHIYKDEQEFWGTSNENGRYTVDRLSGPGDYIVSAASGPYQTSFSESVYVNAGTGSIVNLYLQRSE